MRPFGSLVLLACLGHVLPLAAQQRSPAPPGNALAQPFVVERLYERVRYDDDGTGQRRLELRVHVLSEAALQVFGELSYEYNSANERLDVEYVRVLKPGGDTVVAPASAVLDMTGPVAREAPMFSDVRQKVVTVPGLRPGDVLEARLTWTTVTPVAPGQFWFADDFANDAVFLDQRLLLDVPKAKAVLVRTTGAAPPSVSDSADRRIYAWRRSNLQVDTGKTAVALRAARARHAPPSVQATSFRSWDDVGRWYAGLERERETPTAAIRAKADSLVRGRTTLLDSIAAVYEYVSQDFRYVSVSFGIGRYQPHAAADVLVNQYGDCKDKHVLLASLLRALGVASSPVLISTDRDVDSTVPTPQQFDHVITFLVARGDTVWLDATPGAAPFRLLDFALRGTRALVIPLDGTPRLLRTPEQPPFALVDSVLVDGRIDATGSFAARYTYVLRGEAETVLRLVLRQLPREQWGALTEALARRFDLPGTTSATQASDLRATRDPLRFSFRLDQPHATSAGEISYHPPVPRLTLPDADSTAAVDSILLAASEADYRFQLLLPPGASVSVPRDVDVARRFATYRSAYRVRGDTVTLERVLRFLVRAVPPDQTKDYLAFKQAVRADEGANLVLTRSGAGPDQADADVQSLAQAGWEALQRGDARTAIEDYRRALSRDPTLKGAWNNVGRAYWAMRQLDSAMAAYRQAIAVDSNDAWAYNNLGLAEWRLHQNDSALAAFRHQIAVNAADPYAHANLGRLALELHQDSLAVAELSRAAAITPNDPSLQVALAGADLASQDTAGGAAALTRALAIRSDVETLNNAAYTLADAGVRLDTAERYERLALDSIEASLRDVSLRVVDFKAAAALARLGPYWDTMGWIRYKQGDLAGALRYLRAAWFLTYHDGTIGEHLGRTYERLGRRQEAIKTYAIAAGAGAPSPGARARLDSLLGAAQARTLLARAHWEETDLRTIHLSRVSRRSAAGEVQLLVAAGPRVADVRVTQGGPELEAVAAGLKSAGGAFAFLFPDSSALQIPLRGILACSASSAGCTFIATQGVMMGPPAVTVPERR